METDTTGSEPLRTDLTPVIDAIADAEAAAFVAVGDRFDDGLRYLTRFAGPDRPYATVIRPGSGTSPPRAVLLAPGLFAEQAEREVVDAAEREVTDGDEREVTDGDEREVIDGDEREVTDDDGRGIIDDEGSDGSTDFAPVADRFHDGVVRSVRTDRVGDPAGVRAAAAVDGDGTGADGDGADADGDDRTLLVPASIPHDAAVYLDRAGYELASTTVIEEMRAVKTPAEIARLRTVQRATAAGMARAETVLAESVRVGDADGKADSDADTAVGGELRWNDEPLTTERLRRAVNATLAAHGVRDAGNTVIGAGPSAADLHYVGTEPIRAGETVLLDVSPRGPDGYYGDLTRTFVVDGDGGWSRRAYVAVEAARKAALAELEPGVTAATVHEEAAAELGAYGFDPSATEGEPGFTHGTGHGVGVSLHESPSLSGETALRPGHVVTVEPGVYDPDIGGVRLEDLVLVTEDGYELLAQYPFGTTPTSRE